MLENVNELSIVVAAIVSVAVGSIWYSPLLFGRAWVRAAALPGLEQDLPLSTALFASVKGVLAQAILFYVIIRLISFLGETGNDLLVLWASTAAIISSFLFCVMVWERRPLSYFFVHAGYALIAVALGLAIIMYWPW